MKSFHEERSKSGDETGDKTGEEIGEEDNLDDDANLIKENLMKLEATMSSHSLTMMLVSVKT